MVPEEKILYLHNNQITRCREQRNNIKRFKGERSNLQVTYKGKPIRITSDFSTETMKARRAWSEVMQTLREHKYQPRLLYQQNSQSTLKEKPKYSRSK